MGDELKRTEELDDYGRVVALENAQSLEAQEQAVAALGRIGDKYLLPHEGLDAQQTLVEYDRRMKVVDKLDREFYKGDTRAYGRHIAAHANERANRRKALVSAVTAEMKHGMNVAIKNDTERRIDSLIETDSLEAAGVLANQSADGEIASETMTNGIEQTTSENEFATDRLKEERDAKMAEAKTDDEKKKIADDYRAKKAAVDTATTATRTAIGMFGIEELSKISKQEEVFARSKATSIRQEFRNIFMQKYKAFRSMNQSHEIAYANALEATRQGSIRYFSERMKGGQVGSVLYTLDELEKSGDEMFRQSVTDETPTGVYDPSAYGFCRKSDLFALRKAAKQQLDEARAEARAKESLMLAEDGAKLKTNVYMAQTLIDGLYDSGDVTSEKSAVLTKNLEGIIGNINAIYGRNPKLIGQHVQAVKNHLRRAQARYDKAMNTAMNCKNEAEFGARLDALESSTLPTETVKVPLYDENGELKETEVEMDTHKAYLVTLGLARKAGFFKDREHSVHAMAHTEPVKRAKRIQDAINSFFTAHDKGGEKRDKSASGKIILDVNKDGSVGFSNSNKELGGVLFEDALEDGPLWMRGNQPVSPSVIRTVVDRLDWFCCESLVTPKEDELLAELNAAYNDALAKHDDKAFCANFLDSLQSRTIARFDADENRRMYGQARQEFNYRKSRELPISDELAESVRLGKMSMSFSALRRQVVPKREQYKRAIMRGGDSDSATGTDGDLMSLTEE